MRFVLAAAAAAGLLLSGQAAFAQDSCADGQMVIMRINKIKPGQAALFAEAVADQQAWYRSHGVTSNQQLFGPVAAMGAAPSGEMITLHMNAPMSGVARDAGFEAFVKKFRDSSDMVSEARACVRAPK